MTEDAELAAEYDRARGYNLPPADRPQVRAHLVGLTDEERDLLRDWWDEDTTVGVESSFPIISRIIAARLAQQHSAICEYALIEERDGLPCTYTGAVHRPAAEKPNGVTLYLDILQSMNPSARVQAVIDEIRAEQPGATA